MSVPPTFFQRLNLRLFQWDFLPGIFMPPIIPIMFSTPTKLPVNIPRKMPARPIFPFAIKAHPICGMGMPSTNLFFEMHYYSCHLYTVDSNLRFSIRTLQILLINKMLARISNNPDRDIKPQYL